MNILKTCEFMKQGFHVRESDEFLAITTPQTFLSGDPAKFWVVKDFDNVTFNDYGFTHNALSLSIPSPEKADDIIKSTLIKLDSMIDFDGVTLTRNVPQEKAGTAIADFLNLYALLTNYQPKNSVHQDIMAILDNIFIYLNKRYGDVERNVKYKGLSGSKHSFSFQSEDTLIEFSKSTSQNTGALLRKIQDVKVIYDDFDFSIILDDSNKGSFEKESRILSTVANVTPYSVVAA